jgi:uncharacterized damage-inducible protein DinB
MNSSADLFATILPAWQTNARITEELVAALPREVFQSSIPGFPHRTVRMLAAHLHNARCMWLRTLGKPLGLTVPRLLDPRRERKSAFVRALRNSSREMEALLAEGCARGGRIPPSPKYVWRNLALDVGHVLTYFVAHEAHHRGQLALIARQLGAPLPRSAVVGLWQWKPPAKRSRRGAKRRRLTAA